MRCAPLSPDNSCFIFAKIYILLVFIFKNLTCIWVIEDNQKLTVDKFLVCRSIPKIRTLNKGLKIKQFTAVYSYILVQEPKDNKKSSLSFNSRV